MHLRINIEAVPGRMLVWFLIYSALLSTSIAQRLDTLLPVRPSDHDAPAYISSTRDRVAIRGDFVFVAAGNAGLVVYKFQGHAPPQLLGAYPTGGYVAKVFVEGNRAYVWGPQHGTLAFDVSNPADLRPAAVSPDAIAHAMTTQNAADSSSPSGFAAIAGNRLYVAADNLGVVEIDFEFESAAPTPQGSPAIIQSPGPPRQPMAAATVRLPLSEIHRGIPGVQIQVEKEMTEQATPVETRSSSALPIAVAPELTASFQAGTLTLRVSGKPGQTVRIQRTSDLRGEWEEWQTTVLDEAAVELIDPTAADKDQTSALTRMDPRCAPRMDPPG
jgi:hypothetical protein